MIDLHVQLRRVGRAGIAREQSADSGDVGEQCAVWRGGEHAGEQQLCLVLTARGKAVTAEEQGRAYYLIDPEVHELLLDAIASHGFRLKASAPRPA